MEGVRNLNGIDNYSSTIKQFNLVYVNKKGICAFGVINKTNGCNIPAYKIQFNIDRAMKMASAIFLFWLQNF